MPQRDSRTHGSGQSQPGGMRVLKASRSRRRCWLRFGGSVQGVQVSAPFGKYKAAAQVLGFARG